jgi:hypothetical protein
MSVLQITKSMIVLILSSEVSPMARMHVRKIPTRIRSRPDIRSRVALSVLTGAVLGAAAIQGLHGQSKPPAYVVAEIDET